MDVIGVDKLHRDIKQIIYRYLHREKLQKLNQEYMTQCAPHFGDKCMYFRKNKMYCMYRRVNTPGTYFHIYDIYGAGGRIGGRIAKLPKNY